MYVFVWIKNPRWPPQQDKNLNRTGHMGKYKLFSETTKPFEINVGWAVS